MHADFLAWIAHRWRITMARVFFESLRKIRPPDKQIRIYAFSLCFILLFLAAVIPLFLVIMFEVAYAVHKRRSVKFCGIVFDVR